MHDHDFDHDRHHHDNHRKFRGQFATAGDVLTLISEWRSPVTGTLIELDTYPSISIVSPDNNVIMPFTSMGVFRIDLGHFAYDFPVTIGTSQGIFCDNWRGFWGGNQPYNSYNFVVSYTQMPGSINDGYEIISLGDEPGFDFSQNELKNINKLLALLRARLNSKGKALIKDKWGNSQLVDCDVFNIPDLTLFLIGSLSSFNEIPFFTDFTMEDSEFFNQFESIIVTRALIEALYSKSAIEKAREMTINDNGISLQIPGIADILMSQATTMLGNWNEQVKNIKNSMRMRPLGLGGFYLTNASPAIRRLRFLRARQIL